MIRTTPYEVRTPVFEGPFDLLLHLILRQEVDLWEVSLSTIVDAYLAEIERMEGLDLEVATDFLLIAATLVELKARRLLPAPAELDLDEELLRFEARDLLLARLLEYKTFKDVAGALAARLAAAARSLARRAGPEEPLRSLVADPLERIRPEQLRSALARILAPKPVPTVDTDHVAPIRASVAEAVELVLARLPERATTTFRDLARGSDSRLELVVRFLAILELYKQGVIEIEQLERFGDITLRRRRPGEVHLDLESLEDWADEPARRAR